jgi:hypothetical protein
MWVSPTLFPEDAAVYPGGSGIVDFVLGTGGELSSTTHCGGGGGWDISANSPTDKLLLELLLVGKNRACEAVDDVHGS